MANLSQGGRANQSGRSAEDVISAILTQHACFFSRQEPIGKGIYKTDLFADFFIRGHARFPNGLIIESKRQDASGSVDEKLPYLVANIRECYPCSTIIVLCGGGFRTGAEQWLKRQIGGSLLLVFHLEEFLTWCNRNL